MTHDVARRIVQALLGRIRTGQVVIVEGGARRTFGHGAPSATIEVRSPAAWTALARGGRGLAESYAAGLWETPDLTAVICVAVRNIEALDDIRRRLTPVRVPFQYARSTFARNTPPRSRRDISAHYDLGNELFGLMLDPTMMYSCGFFERPNATLQEGSIAKLERICEQLDLGPEDHVLEIGTGWGGFAMHAAATRGCPVTTTTISREQHAYATARVEAAGLSDRVTILLEDYRELRGTYDKLVSIEMIEAVGWKDFGTFFGCCSRLLAPSGAMFLQAITMDDRAFDVEKASKSFIRTLIFPNGCLPSNAVIASCLRRRTDMRMVALEDITPHYAETLRRWRQNFEANAERLEQLGYDERFRRMWRFYLCYCEAGFAERRIGDVQMVLAKPLWRARMHASESVATAGLPVAIRAAGG